MIDNYKGDYIVTNEQYERLLNMATTGKMIDLLNEIYLYNANRISVDKGD